MYLSEPLAKTPLKSPVQRGFGLTGVDRGLDAQSNHNGDMWKCVSFRPFDWNL